MKNVILLLLLVNLSFSLFAQKEKKPDKVKVSSQAQYIFVPERVKQENEVKAKNDSLQKDLDEYVQNMQDEKIISDNVIVSINADVIDEDEGRAIKVEYSYALKNDTLKYKTDDFSLGRYTLDASNAMQVTLEIMKRSIENQLAKYIGKNKNISFTINGSADAAPIRSTLPYKGEYGDRLTEMCTVENTSEQMLITKEHGISTNEELAFLRSYTVRDFIENQIPVLQSTQNDFTHHAQVSKFKGGQHRRVSVEMIIHKAFENPENE